MLKRHGDTIIRYGRILRDIEHRSDGASTDGAVCAAGVGMIPISVAIAAADLDDARQARTQHLDDPDTNAALSAAIATLTAEVRRFTPPHIGAAGPTEGEPIPDSSAVR